jgi:aspartyl-tRNA(Asn)/glutamyl-tRNA(Gln) amidotransferase subunit B
VNWVQGDVLGYLNESGLSTAVLPLSADGLAELADLAADGTLSRNQAKDVLDECLREPKRPKQVVEERGLAQVSDETELAAVVDRVFADHAADVAEYHAGDDKMRKKKRGFLIGQAMQATGGAASGQVVGRLVDDRLSSS